MIQKIQTRALLGAAALLLAACTVNPVTGERELSLIAPQQAVAMGIEQYSPGQQSQGGVYQVDPDLNDYINEIGQNLARVSDVPYLPYEFVVLNNGVPNAWALPGGKIAINRGLLTELEDEAQLAAVLGHEVVHAAANHGANQMSRNTLLNIGLLAAGVASQHSDYGQLVQLGSQIGGAAWMASYGRNDELVSDQYGMLYMSRAGYDPYAAVELQETFVRLSEGRGSDFISGLFASHPPSQSRVDANIEHARALPQGGERYRDRYQAAIAQIVRDQPAYDAYDNASEALANGNAEEAMRLLDRAVDIQPNESHFWELRGHAWSEMGNTRNAETAFSTAIDKNSDYFQHWLVRGLLRRDQGRNGAETDLQMAQALLPTSTGAFALGQIAEDSGDTASALSYYRSVAGAQGEIGSAAQIKIARYELESAPESYIATAVQADAEGRLMLVVENRAPVAVTSVVVRLSLLSNGMGRDYQVPASLQPGERTAILAGMIDDPTLYRADIIAARPL